MPNNRHRDNEPPRRGGLLFKPGDSVRCTGLIVSSEIQEKEWDGVKSKSLRAMITNSRQSFLFTATDKRGPLPEIQVGRRADIEVDWAKQDNGMLTVAGRFNYES